MNKLDFWLIDHPRERTLRNAVYRAMAQLALVRVSQHDVKARSPQLGELAER
jgi:hypothetical protein